MALSDYDKWKLPSDAELGGSVYQCKKHPSVEFEDDTLECYRCAVDWLGEMLLLDDAERARLDEYADAIDPGSEKGGDAEARDIRRDPFLYVYDIPSLRGPHGLMAVPNARSRVELSWIIEHEVRKMAGAVNRLERHSGAKRWRRSLHEIRQSVEIVKLATVRARSLSE